MSGIVCPRCGERISGYDPKYDRLNLELGRCVDCGGDKTYEEIAGGTWRCRRCRQRRADHMQRKRHLEVSQ